MRMFLSMIVMMALAAGAAVAQQDAKPQAAGEPGERPNIVFIMVDDMARDWVGCYGGAGKTPNIDRLAAEGVKFETAWATPLCTPTRSVLFSGKYPFETGWINHHDVPRWGGDGFDPRKYPTWANRLRDAGYATAIAGKWQIDDLRQGDPLKEAGFDEHCMWPGGEAGNPGSDERYADAYLTTNGKSQVHKGRFGPDVVNDFLCDFIRRSAGRNRPFLAYYPMVLVHSPYVATPWNNKDAPTEKDELYAGMVAYMDHLVGRVIATLDKAGVLGRTIIIFTADNGSSIAGSLGGVKTRPAKAKVSNMGVHVPLIIRAPMYHGLGVRSGAGRSIDALVDFTDLYPTIMHLSGVRPERDSKYGSRSLMGYLVFSSERASGLARGCIISQLGDRRIVRDDRFIMHSDGALYDLKSDPFEERDLRDSTDPAAKTAKIRLSEVLASLPPDAAAPFKGYGDQGEKKQKKKK